MSKEPTCAMCDHCSIGGGGATSGIFKQVWATHARKIQER